MINTPRIIFLGTPEFAVPSLLALIGKYHIAAVVTNPDEPIGRAQTLTFPPVKPIALSHGISVLQPDDLKSAALRSELPEADLFIVAAYGKIIPKEILVLPRLGALNIHPSLLPRWRGPSPIQHAILHGDNETGVSIMKIDAQMDHGPILASDKLLMTDDKITYQELYDRLAAMGAELLIKTLPRYFNEEITLIPQDDAKATYSKILKKEDGRIDWKRPAEEIERMVRAFTPWPGAWTLWPIDQKIYRVRVEDADVISAAAPVGVPGYIVAVEDHPITVKTGRGSLIIKKITLEGKKSLTAESFIRGYPKIIGQTFI